MVSVVMITYGHEQFIKQAIEGVLMQQCDFEVELIIANDCSPDNTESVINQFRGNHPKSNWIKYTKHHSNKGMMPNFIWALQQAKGKYIALCEGDDYWTDSLKLQKQVDFLEVNPDYVLSFHRVKILQPNGKILSDYITKVPEYHERMEDLATIGNYIHTPSVVFRNLIKEFPFEFSQSPIGDYFLYMMLVEHGKLKYIKEDMAIYRFGAGVYSNLLSSQQFKKWLRTNILILSYSNNEKVKAILLARLFDQLNLNDSSEKGQKAENSLKGRFSEILKLSIPQIFFIIKRKFFLLSMPFNTICFD